MPKCYPSRGDLEQYRQQGNLVPIYLEISGDLETPVSTYLKLARGKYSFLLESVEGGERLGRYSFIGTEPYLVLVLKDGRAVTVGEDGSRKHSTFQDPLDAVVRHLKDIRLVPIPGMPPCCGGAVGYLSFECARYFGELPGSSKPGDPDLPDAVFMYTNTLAAFDHVRRSLRLITHVPLDGDLDQAYAAAESRLEELVRRLQRPLAEERRAGPVASSRTGATPTANQTREQFMATVGKIQEYIAAGECMQVVPSLRFSMPITAEPLGLYRALRSINPSPYLFYLDLDGFQLVGSSPESLVKLVDGIVQIRPLAGTRPRSADPLDDARLEAELLHDPKELAEHMQLVDLAREDLERVCDLGSIRTVRSLEVERYSHVMHIVSELHGDITEGAGPAEVLRAAFPAGTLTGAPRKRAMEIISELEPTRRGPYGGAVGYFSYSGNLDSAITIRTMVVKDGAAYIQAGAGVVAQSEPEREYLECMNKAKALLDAVELAPAFARRQGPRVPAVGGMIP